MDYLENTGEKVKSFLKSNIYIFITILAGVIYVARGLIRVVETGKTPYEILADGLLATLFAFFISKTLGLQGFLRGEREEKVILTRKKHGEIVEEISPYIDRLDDFCVKKTEEVRSIVQSKLLAKEGLVLGDLHNFLLEGTVNGYDKKTIKRRRKLLKKVAKLKITPLTTANLTGDDGNSEDPLRLGMTKKSYMAKTDAKRIVGKIGTGLLFGYYGVNMITDFSLAQLIWTAIQAIMFIVMGMTAYMQSYFFITDTYRGKIIRKMDYLLMFKNEINKENQETPLCQGVSWENKEENQENNPLDDSGEDRTKDVGGKF